MFDATAYPPVLSRDEIVGWLHESDELRLLELWRKADTVREARAGSKRHLLGIIVISNHCVHTCDCCALRRDNTTLTRRRMTPEQIFDAADRAVTLACGTLVLQAGHDRELSRQWFGEVIWRLKRRVPSLKLLVSAGDRCLADLAAWRALRADGYFLGLDRSMSHARRRTATPYEPAPWMRVDVLRSIIALGYAAASSVIVGLPGQTHETLADELLQFHAVGIGTLAVTPYAPASASAKARNAHLKAARLGEQAPHDSQMVHKVVALARLLLPTAIIPSPNLRGDDGGDGEDLGAAGLRRGANAVMVDLTPCEHADARFTNACGMFAARPCRQMISSQIEEMSQLFLRPSPAVPQSSCVP
jgi:biotin synthase